jgi:hypothetical protein
METVEWRTDGDAERPREQLAAVPSGAFGDAVGQIFATSDAQAAGGGDAVVKLDVSRGMLRLLGGDGRRVGVAPIMAGTPKGGAWSAAVTALTLRRLGGSLAPGGVVWICRTVDAEREAVVLVCNGRVAELVVRDDTLAEGEAMLAVPAGPQFEASREEVLDALRRVRELLTAVQAEQPFLVDVLVADHAVALWPESIEDVPPDLTAWFTAVVGEDAVDATRLVPLGVLEGALQTFTGRRVVVHLGAGDGDAVTLTDPGCHPTDPTVYQQRVRGAAPRTRSE